MADPAARLSLGEEFAGYRIEAVIGRGGMGIVYRAVSLDHLHRTVALKVVAPEHAEDPEFRERFISEARMAASIEHPNVIPVYEARDSGGRLFLAMRFVDGTDLDHLIGAEGRIAPARAAEIVAQVAAALDRSHARRLVHRDVKPANILIEADGGHVLLTDFGIARAFDVSSASGSTHVIGTLDYMAPERFEGRLDRRADIYALGCVLYQALVGEIPFPRATPAEKIWAHMNAPPPEPDALPVPFRPVVAKALAKDPEQRYATAGALAEDATAAAALCAEASTDPLPAPDPEPRPEPVPGPRPSTQDTVIVPDGGQAPERPAPQRPRPPQPPADVPRGGPPSEGGGDGARRRRLPRPSAPWAAAALAAGVAVALLATGVLPPKGDHTTPTTTFTTDTSTIDTTTIDTSTIDTTTIDTTTIDTTTLPAEPITESQADATLDDYARAFNDRSRDELYPLVRGAVVRHESNGQTYSGYVDVLNRYDTLFAGFSGPPDFAFTSRTYSADGSDARVFAHFTIGTGAPQSVTFHLSRFENGPPEIDDIDFR